MFIKVVIIVKASTHKSINLKVMILAITRQYKFIMVIIYYCIEHITVTDNLKFVIVEKRLFIITFLPIFIFINFKFKSFLNNSTAKVIMRSDLTTIIQFVTVIINQEFIISNIHIKAIIITNFNYLMVGFFSIDFSLITA